MSRGIVGTDDWMQRGGNKMVNVDKIMKGKKALRIKWMKCCQERIVIRRGRMLIAGLQRCLWRTQIFQKVCVPIQIL